MAERRVKIVLTPREFAALVSAWAEFDDNHEAADLMSTPQSRQTSRALSRIAVKYFCAQDERPTHDS